MKRFSDIIQKSTGNYHNTAVIKGKFKIAKSDNEKMLAF